MQEGAGAAPTLTHAERQPWERCTQAADGAASQLEEDMEFLVDKLDTKQAFIKELSNKNIT